jgi:hypothetical protein
LNGNERTGARGLKRSELEAIPEMAILPTAFAFCMPYAFLFHQIGLRIAAQLHAALSAL